MYVILPLRRHSVLKLCTFFLPYLLWLARIIHISVNRRSVVKGEVGSAALYPAIPLLYKTIMLFCPVGKYFLRNVITRKIVQYDSTT